MDLIYPEFRPEGINRNIFQTLTTNSLWRNKKLHIDLSLCLSSCPGHRTLASCPNLWVSSSLAPPSVTRRLPWPPPLWTPLPLRWAGLPVRFYVWFVFGCKVLVCLTLLLYTNDSVFQARGCDPKLCHLEFKWGHLKSLVIDKKLPIQIIFLFSQTWSKTNSRKENVTRHLCCQNGVTSQKKIGNHWSSRLMLYFPAVIEPCVGAVWMISLFVLILVFRSCPQSHWSMVELESLLCPSYFLFIDQGIQLWLEHILHKDRRDRRLCLSLTKTYPTL